MAKTEIKKEGTGTTGPVCVYDFTLFDEIPVQDIRNTLKEISKKYCFQQEKGEQTGKKHYQGRISLKMKKRKPDLIKELNKNWKAFHITLTSNENKNNNFYVMKEETRVDGPFTDENEIFIPRDIKEIKKLYPWQEQLKNKLKTYNQRIVDIIYDPDGNKGKTIFTRWMMIYEDCQLLPFCNDYKDIMRMAYDVGPKKIYIIDIPKSIDKSKLNQFYAGIESLKGGYVYDERYNFKQRLFDPPRICVFTNTEPETHMLSKDRWNIWQINEDNELSQFNTENLFENKPNKQNNTIETIMIDNNLLDDGKIKLTTDSFGWNSSDNEEDNISVDIKNNMSVDDIKNLSVDELIFKNFKK